MNKKIASAIVSAAVIAAVALPGTAASAATSIAGKGSSFANSGIQDCLSTYTDNTVTYTSTGSGTGRKEYKAGNVQFAVSDGTYAATDSQPASYTMTPLFGGPVVFAYNKNSGIPAGLKLDAATISQILKGTVTKWNAPEIKRLNKGKKFPNATIKVFYRSGTSGTNENLTNYLSQAKGSAGGWTKNQDITKGAGGGLPATAVSSATSQALALNVEGTAYGFGYFDLSDGADKLGKVSFAKLKNEKGEFVAPTAAAGAKFLNAQTVQKTGDQRTDGTYNLDFTKKIKGAYQLTIATYGLAPKAATDDNAKAVEGFFSYVVNTCMPKRATKLGYIALKGASLTAAKEQIAGISN